MVYVVYNTSQTGTCVDREQKRICSVWDRWLKNVAQIPQQAYCPSFHTVLPLEAQLVVLFCKNKKMEVTHIVF